MAALWTPSSLYLGYWSSYQEIHVYADKNIHKERWELWNRDVVEVFLNPFPERLKKYWEFEVAPNNQWLDLTVDLDQTPPYDPSWDSGFHHATLVDKINRVWQCEMRIPVTSLGLKKIQTGDQWRINFFRCEGPESKRHYLAWSPSHQMSFHEPRRFGIIHFRD